MHGVVGTCGVVFFEDLLYFDFQIREREISFWFAFSLFSIRKLA